MYKMSPISVIDNVKSKVLMLIGKLDRRVPCSEGLRYIQYLKSRNVDATLYRFDDTGHSLDSNDAEQRGFEIYYKFIMDVLKW